LALALSSASVAQPAHSLAEDAAAFGARESAVDVSLSPSGTNVAYVAPIRGGGSAAFVAHLATNKVTPFLKSGDGAEQLDWCQFVTDSRLVCRYRKITNQVGMLIGFSRLIAVDDTGANMKGLGQSESFYDAGLRQFDGTVIDWLPGEGGSVLMARAYVPEAGRTGTRLGRSKEGLGVDRIDTVSLKATAIEAPNRVASGFMSDGRGSVRVMSMAERSGDMLTGRTKYLYRAAGSRDWEPLTDYVEDDDFAPLAVDASSNALYALKPLNGRQALYRITLTKPTLTELVASHPSVDIDNVKRSANGQKVIGYTFVTDKRETVYFDPEYKALAASLSKAIPNLPLIRFAGTSDNGRKLLIHAGADNDSGRYYLFDRDSKQLAEIMLARPELEKRTLASVKPVTVAGADGTPIPAYLTLPNGKQAKNLPAVVLPHGGPSSRDEWGFDWLSQFLAARGYAVIQPNYRGSAGFGDAWLMENGFKNWRTSISDITASAKWLAAQGIADPARTAIVGWSYGGYAALQAAEVEPSLFKAVVAVAPVTDLADLKREAEGYTSARIVADFVGSGPHIREGSPLQNAAAIKVPVLLAHGDMDQNVGIGHSDRMAAALKKEGVPVEYLRYKGLDHQLDDTAARTEMLTKIGALLEKTIGQ
jgi:dipeptidyl aminopeptidase/acylaminoacyl peptidase